MPELKRSVNDKENYSNSAKEMVTVKRNRFIGGIVLLVLAALAFLFLSTDASVPVAITLMVVGIALIASSRRGG